MLALVRDGRNDPPVTLQEVPEPQPKEGEALVQVRASTVNRGELVRTDATGAGSRLADRGVRQLIAGAEPETAAFEVVVDVVGGASLERAIRAVRPGGTIMLLGATDPQPARITLLDFIGHEGARILTFFSYAGDDAAIGPDLDTLAQLEIGRASCRERV